MPCYHPITAYRSKQGRNSNGAWPLVFNAKDGYIDMSVQIPCGRCIGCRLERSRQWAIRCTHEAQLHEQKFFGTFTFSDENVCESLEKSDFQKFMKRLRKEFPKNNIRYFHCGEYGEKLGRPHHHAIIYGVDFEDKEELYEKRGNQIYTSKKLEDIWQLGLVSIGDVTWESASYVARYCTKKITGDKAAEHYGDRIPEYVTMSLKPAIAKEWYQKYKNDLYNQDICVVNNTNICKPAKYYDKLYDIDDKYHMEVIKARRRRAAAKSTKNTYDRLIEREKVQKIKAKKLKRGFETCEDEIIYNTNDKYISINENNLQNRA